jgi:hypothetical protein
LASVNFLPKITSDVFRASLIINSRITGIYVLEEKCINDTTVRADCKQIGLYSGWNGTKSGFG